MLYYRTLGIEPDFRTPPVIGAEANTRTLESAPAPKLIRWPEDHNPRTMAASFTLRGPLEVFNFREFVRTQRGPWMPFYMPSWQQEFTSADTVAIGTESLDISIDLAAFLAENRPDTFGRTVFFYTPARELHTARVLTSTSNGGTWTIELDSAFPFAADLSACILGFAWLVRFAQPNFPYRHLTPDKAAITTSFQEVVNTAGTQNELALTMTPLGQTEAFTTITEEDADPTRTDMRASALQGPEFYDTAQAENFTKSWAASLSGGVYTFTDGALETEISAIYDGGDAVDHISMAFDALASESIGWQLDFETIRVVWHDGASTDALEFAGRTPVMFQSFTINGSITAGQADVYCFYLKENDSKIYARLQSESFATENTLVNLPIMPLALIDNNIAGDGLHLLRGLSTRHTKITLSSALYDPVTTTSRDTGSAAATVTGEIIEDVGVNADPQADAGSGTGAEVSGDYVSASVDDAQVDAGSGTEAQVSGEYVDTALDDAEVDTGTADALASGEYVLTAEDSAQTDTGTATAAVSGEYATPP